VAAAVRKGRGDLEEGGSSSGHGEQDRVGEDLEVGEEQGQP